MAAPADMSVRQLVVTGPERERLFEHFSRLFYGHADVIVFKDRRYGERRGSQRAVGLERRSAERRVRRPDWLVPPDTVDDF